MSRIGKLPITIPSDVTIDQVDNQIVVKGPKGELSTHVLSGVELVRADSILTIVRKSDSLNDRATHGLARQLIANMILGVTTGFEKRLELKGVGYRAATEGDRKLILTVGFSHPVSIEAPDHTNFKVEKNVIIVSGNDKQVVGEISAQIRRVRPPEPYKGKGIMYQGEHVRRKAGKAAKAAG